MSEHPILFSDPMVRAILDGRKTQTRRIIDMKRLRVRLPNAVGSDPGCLVPILADPGVYAAKMNPQGAVSVVEPKGTNALGVKPGEFHFVCPYAEGDTHLADMGGGRKVWRIVSKDSRLWVLEAFSNCRGDDSMPTHYRADDRIEDLQRAWNPSIFMPRWASRIDLEVTGVRVERLQAITQADALAEGMPDTRGAWVDITDADRCGPRGGFEAPWNDLDGKRATWESNPWVWVISFRRVRP